MGTLTADIPRLDSHCPHKLATSCRLTSTPNCCACADERPHSRTYRVYIDGVGFVQRGTRWQGYCWFCKEFWSNRLAATDPPLDVSQTRIPEVPDQTEFLARWNEFHQGYRVVKLADGSEQRIAVLGEPFKEVSPGFLPRSLDQLRASVENDARRPENRFSRRRLSEEEERPEAPQPSLEDALDSLLQEAADAEVETSGPQEQAVPATPEMADIENTEPARPLTRRDAQQQRRREQFQRVFGSREDLQQEDYESPLTSMYSRAYDRYRQAEERRADGTTIAPTIVDGISVQERRDIEEQLLWGVMRDSQAMSESLEREGDVWSYTPIPVVNLPTVPIDSVEDVPLNRTSSSRLENLNSLMDQFARIIDPPLRPTRTPPSATPSTTAAPNPSLTATSSFPTNTTPTPTTTTRNRSPDLSDIRTSLAQMTSELARLRLASSTLATHRRSAILLPHTPPTLDNQPDRPPPATDADMTKLLACQVCYQQLADTALLPCGHMVMCQWCADVVVPVRHVHIPVGVVKCPMCRKIVKQRFRIHM
ncbi:hypothetical protein J1614_008423 [Plenodomus biglobosus]|nr:hypothetical protein J1614_008423 [Plenodomus biglobosus]